MTTHDTQQISRAGDCFRLLSACFYEPDKALFLEQKVCDNLAMLLEGFSPIAATSARLMSESLLNQDQEQLVLDHAALFVGPFELHAAPYGSIYLEKKREVMGESTIKVMKFYRDAGLEVEENEPADHIAIELEFMSFLCGEESRTAAEGRTAEAERYRNFRLDFFTACLQTWVDDFCGAIRAGTTNVFYLSLADCLAGFLTSQQKCIDKAA
ncbi:TorD/DmsD family molecular chaperone [Desulfopila inferna]|uniref:TorD/DmsD family molecular chaperone n=1 Tax=Desulfopila inferna TaxID=468528 RepID=UPI001962B7ED|nr:molecular chaperone TorD family protein [Desulfopila inferna]MBM9604842.1 molecular chaperone TorD family protein [Desulfopila inferna]